MPSEAIVYTKLKAFCVNIVKKLAPPLLKEVQASTLQLDAEPFTPRRTTRATKKAGGAASSKATPAENVLLRALGLAPHDLQVDEQMVEDLKGLFDSPLREQHIRVIASLFGKTMPIGGDLGGASSTALGVH